MARNALLNALQAASNEAAGTISGPVDLLSWGLRKAGVPVPRRFPGCLNRKHLRGSILPSRAPYQGTP